MAVIDSRFAGALKPISQSTSVNPCINAIRKWVSELTDIDLKLVRKPQRKVGTQPPIDTDWVSVSIDGIKTHGTPEQRGTKGIVTDPTSGDATKISHQTLKVSVSFYGENAMTNADLFRESSQVLQNIEYLKTLDDLGLTVQGVRDEVMHLPDFAHEQRIDRYVVELAIGRKVERTFGIRTIASATAEIFTEKGKVL